MPRLLTLEDGSRRLVWCKSSAAYVPDYAASGGQTFFIGLRCRLGRDQQDVFALLDTAAEFTVVGGEWLQLIEQDLDTVTETRRLHTRFGPLDATLRRLMVTIVADEGEDLVVDAAICAVPDWPSEPVIGYRGLLEGLRFALEPVDPMRGSGIIYFGAHS